MADPATAPRSRSRRRSAPIVLVTGMSGAGKSSALKALEDLGFEAVDNIPISLLTKLLRAPDEPDDDRDRPLAIGIDSRTRGFNANAVVTTLAALRAQQKRSLSVLFLDCSGEELARRFSETRRRHPMALDRPVADGIARERELLAPLRLVADVLLDTSDYSIHKLRTFIVNTFGLGSSERMTLTLMSFGFARGAPRDVDLLFDMRFLRNPHWQDELRPQTGLDAPVGAYVAGDASYAEAFRRMRDLLLFLIPQYQREGKSYLTVGFGCTGGKHRSVFVTEQMAAALRAEELTSLVYHRDLQAVAADADPISGDVLPS